MSQAWRTERRDIDELPLALLDTPAAKSDEDIRKAIAYFDNNRERLRYGRFRELGLFIGSSVVEAGGRVIVHQRLKQSGVRWTVRGARSVISLRCQAASGRWSRSGIGSATR